MGQTPLIVLRSPLWRTTGTRRGPFAAYSMARKMFKEERHTSSVSLDTKGRTSLTLKRTDGYDKVSDWYYHDL